VGAGRGNHRRPEASDRGADVWGYWPSWGFSESGVFRVRTFGGEFLDAAGKTVLLDSQGARAAIQ
jgi:hypothetical protein